MKHYIRKILAIISIISGCITLIICEIFMGLYILEEGTLLDILIGISMIVCVDSGVACILLMK